MENNSKMYLHLLFLILTLHSVVGSPKKYQPDDGHRYYESDLPEKNYSRSAYIPQNPIPTNNKDHNAKESRFGTISYGPTGGSYGNQNGVGYGSMKIDIGGVAFGALIGLAAILIVPKIANVLAMGHGGYGRALDDEMSTVTNILSKIDNSLAANNIDSTSCTQRVICSFVNGAVKNSKSGEGSATDELILSLTNNPMFGYVMDGTSIKQAVEIGRTEDGDKCASTYAKCPLSRESVMNVISTLIPAN